MYLEERASLFGVSRQLEARGIPAPRGGKVWSVATLRGILTNPVYTGRIYAGRVRYRPARIRRSATHPIGHPHDSAVPLPPKEWIPVAEVPAVVSQEQFDLASEKLSKNKTFARRNNKAHDYLLRALVSCGRCKLCCIARMQTGANKKYKKRYYVCSGKQKQAQSGLEEKCPSRHAPADQLDELVWEDLCEVMTHPKSITNALERAHGGHWLPQELQARQQNLREGRAALNRQLDRLTDAYLGEVIPLAEYERRRRDLEERDGALAGQERQLEAQADQRMELTGVAGSVEDFCERVRSGLADATFEQKRKLVELLVDRVIVTDEEVEIRYVIPTDPSSEQVRFCHLRSDYLGHPASGEVLEGRALRQLLQVHLAAVLEPLPRPEPENLFGWRLRGAVDHLHLHTERLLRPVFAPSPVARVHPHVREAREAVLGRFEQALYAVLVGDLRAVYPRLDHEPFGVHEDVALPAPNLLAAVKAPLLAAHPGGLGRLAVHDPRARFGISAEPLPQAAAQDAVQSFPNPVEPPPPEVVKDGLPGREVLRQHPPLAAALEEVEDGVEDLARAAEPRSAALLRGWEKRLQQTPLVVSKVARIVLARHATERRWQPAPFSDGLRKRTLGSSLSHGPLARLGHCCIPGDDNGWAARGGSQAGTMQTRGKRQERGGRTYGEGGRGDL
jgi:site-specific DNA recombinase